MARSLFSACLALAVAAAAGQAAAADASATSVQVHFEDADGFSDASDDALSRRTSDRLLEALAAHLREQAAPMLAAGQQLEITVTDLDRAGEYEPALGSPGRDVRVYRSVTVPRIELRYVLSEAGEEIASGEARLVDLNYQQGALATRTRRDSDPLRYEKAMLDAWLRQTLAALV